MTEYVGQFPIRPDIEILPADPIHCKANDHLRINSEGKARKGNKRITWTWTVREVIGEAVINSRGITKGNKSIIIGK